MTNIQRWVQFDGPRRASVHHAPLPALEAGEVRVAVAYSAISAGSELLFYRGDAPRESAIDSSIGALAEQSHGYPVRYGYACAGRIDAVGAQADKPRLGERVFVFHPHTSHITAAPDDLLPIPDHVPLARAALLPNMETAVNFVMDGAPGIGERVAVFGLGVVGLLTTALLARFPLTELTCIDPAAARREQALALGATRVATPEDGLDNDFDLVYELSGRPAVLDDAIQTAGFSGRVVIGSWYGNKHAPLHLGGAFHRKRIRLLSSQVSTIDSRHLGRWDKARRFDLAWQMLAELPLDGLITHRLPVEDAPAAYGLLDAGAPDVIQILLTYQAVTRNS